MAEVTSGKTQPPGIYSAALRFCERAADIQRTQREYSGRRVRPRAITEGALQNKARVHDKESNTAHHAADQKHSDYFFEIHGRLWAELCCRGSSVAGVALLQG